MDAKSERKEGVLIFFINGRLDAFGAQQLDEWIKGALHDDDKELILDLSGSTYLSSGGLRTFNILKKEMKRRNGRFALAAVGEYPKKVLDMAGFSTIIEMFPTVDAAVEDMKKKRKNPTLFNEIFYKKIEEEGISLTIEPGWMTSPPALRVTGDMAKVLNARLTEADIKTKKFSEITYSLGLGALGADKKEAMPLLGEMITLYGSMVWLPTDGNNTPDFLTPLDTESDVPVYTGYNVTLDGPFNEYLTLSTGDAKSVSIADIYRMIFSGAKSRVKSYKGIVAVAIWGVLEGLSSSGIKKAPVAGSGLPAGSSIMDPANQSQWMASDTGMSYKGDTLVSFGFGIDLTGDLSGFPKEDLDALYSTNPASRGTSKVMALHNHGVVFRGVPYDASLDLNSQVKKIVNDATFVDMRHLLDSTRLRRAKIGVAYIQEIVRES
ncbi:STAS domain-containing protein [Methanoregula sp.]|uniref:STAS domain-containing protein n=1 Tax=Methanoregula sp. TaxID=2052170 RepID=UPI002BE00657|nr:STAS domain-containing protein [Methanoregula sp.]HVP95965.1 STAS domain-containing protein [Methanoregula sp.]